jgi:hypothetical protein
MARKKENTIVEISRKLAPRIDDRVRDTQEAVKKQQERDIKKTLKTHRA